MSNTTEKLRLMNTIENALRAQHYRIQQLDANTFRVTDNDTLCTFEVRISCR